MPSSIGHALAGLAVSRLLGGSTSTSWPYAVLATTPDLDIAVGVLRGRRIDYSYRRSHSIGAAVAAGAVAGGAAWLLGGRFLTHCLRGISVYSSHLMLDYFGKGEGSGLPLLWPVSRRRFTTRRPVFGTINSRMDRFVRGLLTRRNLKRVGREVAIIGPAVIVSGFVRGRSSRP